MTELYNGTRIDWYDYFMGIAILSEQRTEEHCYPVGACIVNDNKIIVGTGYNGLTNGLFHAELVALRNKNSRDVKDCTMYVTLFPCNHCANIIIQSGIKTVIYCNREFNDTKRVKAAKKMFDAAGVVYQSYNSIYNKRIPKDKYTRINYDEYFMGIAYISSKRSKSVVKKIGACLVNKNKVIVGIGYNGLTRGLDTIPTNCVNEEVPASYFEVCHAEINAILNNLCDVEKDCTMYVTSFPCNECAKVILQFKITTVIYMHEDANDKTEIAKNMFDAVGIKYRQCDVNIARIEIFK
ncbi:deoxycytidylate deaminase-like isoform X2 [Pseudomyrmex gracilis]|uniref:deoxycytidylate deaminase-like isoform X2 n=1 Tax=Pseudomyrmex gracilis TaxID=219809 RepID=UPI000994A225|nr:deoxycytidylate deaminase-like isoform X2 [Pseudomyrmex gracilis]